MSPSLPRTPKPPTAEQSLPALPALPAIAGEPADEPQTYEARLAQWGRGSSAAFVIWSFLTSKNLREGVDFQYNGDEFRIGSNKLWRIENTQAANQAKASIDRMMYERQGIKVEDFDRNGLVMGQSEPMLGAALNR